MSSILWGGCKSELYSHNFQVMAIAVRQQQIFSVDDACYKKLLYLVNYRELLFIVTVFVFNELSNNGVNR